MSTKNINYKERIVAFIDILGFRNHIKESVGNVSTRNSIDEILSYFYEIMVNPDQDNAYIEQRGAKKVTSFSDNIVISYGQNCSFLEALYDINRLQIIAINKGFLLRGGVTIGPIRHVDKNVFGPGLNEAYKLESEVALYPRIIFTEETLNKAFESSFKIMESKEIDLRMIKRDLCKKDIDGLYYINFLDDSVIIDAKIDRLKYISAIKKILEDDSKNVKVEQKLSWVKTKIDDYRKNWSDIAKVIKESK